MTIFVGKKEYESSYTFLKRAYYVRYGSIITQDSIFYNKYGKPYFKEKNKPFFSISHSGEYIACVFSDNEIGLDIQRVKSIPENVAHRFLHTNSSDKKERTIEWTKFESYGKQKGIGIPFNDNYYKGNFIISEIISGYIITVCMEKDLNQELELVFI